MGLHMGSARGMVCAAFVLSVWRSLWILDIPKDKV